MTPQPKQTYHVRIIRYTHSLTIEEFMNVGVVMYVPETAEVYYKIQENTSRAKKFFGRQPRGFVTKYYKKAVEQLDFILQHQIKQIELEPSLTFNPQRPTSTIANLFHHLLDEHQDVFFSWSRTISGITNDPQSRLKQLAEEFIP